MSDATVFRDKKFKIGNDASVSCYERGLGSMVCKFFDKETGSYGVKIKVIGVTNQQLTNKLHKPIS